MDVRKELKSLFACRSYRVTPQLGCDRPARCRFALYIQLSLDRDCAIGSSMAFFGQLKERTVCDESHFENLKAPRLVGRPR